MQRRWVSFTFQVTACPLSMQRIRYLPPLSSANTCSSGMAKLFVFGMGVSWSFIMIEIQILLSLTSRLVVYFSPPFSPIFPEACRLLFREERGVQRELYRLFWTGVAECLLRFLGTTGCWLGWLSAESSCK